MTMTMRSHFIRTTLLGLAAAWALGTVQPAHAGKFFNLFNHPDLDWYVIRTEHFNTFFPISKKGPEENYYYVDGTEAARKCALVNEEMYEPTCSQYDTYLEETINVILLEQADNLEGYTIPNFDWIVVSSKHDDRLWRWRGHGDWMRNVMYHEYAHVVSLKRDAVFAENGFGWYISTRWRDGAYNVDAGATVFLGDGDPWWWVEGGAEYTSQTSGVNSWNSNRDMFMRADILEGTLLKKEDWEDYYGWNGGFDGERHYNSGYNFAVYLEEQYGEGIYQSFAVARSEKGWTANWDRVVEDTLNVTVDELRQGWIDWATTKYKKVEADVLAEPAIGAYLRYKAPAWEKPEDDEDRQEWEKKRWVDKKHEREKSGLHNLFPRYSPDGKFYAYSNSRWGSNKLTVQEIDEETFMPFRGAYLDDEEDEELIEELDKRRGATASWQGARGSGQFDWSPDGTRLVYQCRVQEFTEAQYKAKAYTYPGGYDWNTLCISEVQYDEDDEEFTFVNTVRMLGAKRAQDPAWSPDGEWIAFIEFASGNQVLYKMRADDLSETGDTKVALTPWHDQTELEMVDWSPDGSQLVFGAWRHMRQDLWLMNADGSGLRAITDDRYEDRDPYWADDGMIYFASDRVGNIYNIFRFNPEATIGWRDTDRDGIADADDGCPEEPESFNEWDDEDGCPDELPVRITAERVEIGQKVFFDLGTATIQGKSHKLLNAVSRVLKAHPELVRIEVAGHTDSQGKKRDNQVLSEDRAAAVVAYLVSLGVDESRLAPAGYGQTRPLMEGDSEEAYAANRRVEFVILERAEVEDEAVAEPEPEADVPEDPEADADAAAGDDGAGDDDDAAGDDDDDAGDDDDDAGDDDDDADDDAEPPTLQARPEGRDLANAPDSLIVVRDVTDDIAAARATELELDNAALIQITNVLYGAFTPSITPQGNLLYSYYTAYGWKPYGLHRDDFYNHVVDDTALAFEMDEQEKIAAQEDVPTYADATYPVPTGGKYLRPPMAIPLLIFENVSRSHMGFSGGFQLWGSDFLSNHEASLIGLFGEDLYLGGAININKFTPNIYFGGAYRQIKYDYAYMFDQDEDLQTTDDVFTGDLKGVQYLYAGYAGFDIPINYNQEIGYQHVSYGLNYKSVTDGLGQTPLFFHMINNLHWAVASFSEQALYRGTFSVNPRGGVRVAVDAALNYTDILYDWSNGVDADDGQLLDNYAYPEFQFNAIGYIAVPWAKKWEHTLQIDLLLGMIPQNVSYNDEFRGGGQSALNYRNPWSTNTAFSGYESWSLGGETMGILNAAYRLPIRRNIDKKFGVLYLESVFLQFFGTAGNFWSYRTAEDARTYDFYGDPVAYDSADVIREVPFSDRLEKCSSSARERNGGECGKALFPVATQNGNRMLFDVGVELRILANLFNRSTWNSFIRVAYGFNEVGGVFDVDGDDIVTNVDDPNLNAISSEKERPSVRFYIGLGTGW